MELETHCREVADRLPHASATNTLQSTFNELQTGCHMLDMYASMYCVAFCNLLKFYNTTIMGVMLQYFHTSRKLHHRRVRRDAYLSDMVPLRV